MNEDIIAARNSYTTDGQTATLVITRRNGDQHTVKFDDADLGEVTRHVWRIQCGHGSPYVVAGSPSRPMSHVLVGAPGEGRCVYYDNGDTYDNRRANLMTGTIEDRQRHAYRRVGKIAGCVIWHTKDQKWIAYGVGSNGKPCYLGGFPTREDAQAARERHAA